MIKAKTEETNRNGQIKMRLVLFADDQQYYGTHIEFIESEDRELSDDLKHNRFDYAIRAEEFVDTPDGLRTFFRILVEELCKDGDEYAEVRKGDAADFLKAISDPNTGDEIAKRAIANMTYAHWLCGRCGTLASFIADYCCAYSSGNELDIMGRRLAPWMEDHDDFVEDAKKFVLHKDRSGSLSYYKSFFGDPTAEAVTREKRDVAKQRVEEAQKRAAEALRNLENAQKALSKAQDDLAEAMGIGNAKEKADKK